MGFRFVRPIEYLAQCYFTRFPVELGKERAWKWFRSYRKRVAPPPPMAHRTKDGFSLGLDPIDSLDEFIYYWGCWEPTERWVIRKLLRAGDTFVDAGANIGYFTLLASQLVGENGLVVGFEPTPPTFAMLKNNLELNGRPSNVVVHQQALADRTGSVRISVPDVSDSSHRRNRGRNTTRIQGDVNGWDVKSVRLDDALPADRSVRFMKMDIEGAELLAIRGLSQRLARGEVGFLLCEVTDKFLQQLGGSGLELFSMLADFGFRSYLCDNQQTISVDASILDTQDNVNILFSRVNLSRDCVPLPEVPVRENRVRAA